MTPPIAATAAVAAFARRTAVAGFVQGAAAVAFVTCAAFVVVGIAVRCEGGALVPSWWWTLAVAPVLAAGAWRARRVAISRAAAACHLDRRLQLDGLLVAAHEGALDAAWHGELAPRLRTWRAALPAVRWEQLCWRPTIAMALAALVAWWPATPHAHTRAPGALTSVLEGLRERLEQAAAEQNISPETLAELGKRVAELASSAIGDDPAAWRELDELQQRVAREELLARLDGGAGGAARGGAGDDRQREALQHAFTALQDFTRDSGVPEIARTMLQQALRDAAADPQRLAHNVERLRELAGRIADSGGDLASQLQRFGIEMRDLERLRGLATRLGEAAQQPAVGAAGGAHQPGGARGAAPRGAAGAGIGEAPQGAGAGEAPPRFVEPVAAAPTKPLELPAGQAVPSEWVPAGAGIGEPATAPAASEATGTAPVHGAGGATWQLQLSPRHRAVVQRFFASTAPAAGERK